MKCFTLLEKYLSLRKKMIKLFKLLMTACVMSMTTVNAAEYRMIVPFPVGNQADVTVRMIGAVIEKETNDKITIINMPGAETVVGANYFVANEKNVDIILLSATQVAWNPVVKPDVVKYTDKDFNYLSLIGSTYALWVTTVDSGIKIPEDLSKRMPNNVAGFATSYNTNLTALLKKYPQQSQLVLYKGTNPIVTDLLNGSVKMALLTPSQALIEQVKSGNLHIVGTTGPNDTVIDSIKIPSVSKKLGLPSISGFMGFATHARLDPEKSDKIKRMLWQGITHPDTQRILRSFYVQDNHNNDSKKILQFIHEQQKIALKFSEDFKN